MRVAALSIAWFVLLVAAPAQNRGEDAKELLARGTALIASKPAEAVRMLEQALRIDPELAGLRYELGLAYHAIGDEADAEAQLREAALRMPDSAAVHNYLGIVRFQLGDAKAALEEFRTAASLAPKDPNAHFNLGEAWARIGDSTAAVAELRTASSLAPSDASLVRLLERVETKLRAPEGTIQVEVRQVLVPVVVTDAQGHSVTGLKQPDFRVFEDGVEQKITGFAVERAGVPQVQMAGSAAVPSVSETTAAGAAAKPRRTYMILIDTLHTSFQHLASAREALVKRFREEQAGDSQYAVIALGASPEVVINVTRDARAVVSALESKRMQKLVLDGHMGGVEPEMERFRRDLNETRYACDLAIKDEVMRTKCSTGLQRTADESRQISELEEAVMTGFLREMRSIVAQLARARDRRTVVVVSDGFSVEAGEEAMALRNAFFPAGSHCLVPPDVFCPPSPLPTGRMAAEFEPIMQIAAAGNVTIDTLDTLGLHGQRSMDAANSGTSPAVSGAVDRTERDLETANGNTLREIAAATGGTAFDDSNDLAGALERAFADGRDYYTLAYVSTNGNYDGKFRAIAVQVGDGKAQVKAKRGYWASPGAQ